MENKEKKKSKNKDGLFYGIAIILILVISIATSNVNVANEITGFFRTIWDKSQEVVGSADQVETISKGKHVEITNWQVVYAREIYEVFGEEVDKEQAIAILQEIKTLAYQGKEKGVSVSKKEIQAFQEELTQQLKEADESQYGRVVRRYGDEEDYWAILKAEIEDYLIAEKVKAEKKEELENKVDVDVEAELQEYIDELVGYENFKNDEEFLK